MSERDWTETMGSIAQLPSAAMLARGISQATAATLGIKVEYDGLRNEVAYFFPRYKGNKLTGYEKKRAKPPGQRTKGDVCNVGDVQDTLPFGAHKMGDSGAFLVVVESAEDCAAAIEMFAAHGKRYKVVASFGTDAWRRQLEYYEGFAKVAIAFDMDDAGRKGAEEFAAALSYGKAFRMTWDSSAGVDANELLVNRKSDVWFSSSMNAKAFEASGVVHGEEVWTRMQNYSAPDFVPYPEEFALMNQKMGGMRAGEISTWIAGSSIGKTSFIRRIKQHVLQTPGSDGKLWKIGEVELEERGEKTWRGLMQFHAGGRWGSLTDAQRRQVYEETYGTGRIFTVDNGLDAKAKKGGLLGKFKHLHYAKGCRLFFLDHITLGVREFGDKGGSLNDQDSMMEEFLGFVESTNSHMCLISHLRKPPGGSTSWSQGAIPAEEDMKGSGSLYQISADIIAVSRNKMHTDEYERNVSCLHVTKCREHGDTGPADRLYWNHRESRFEQAVDAPPAEEDSGAPL